MIAQEEQGVARFVRTVMATATEQRPSLTQAQREKRRVAFRSILGATAITALKVLVGLSTGSLGILSEAAHSALDLLAAFITFVSVRVSDKPADAEHQYGHYKVENFSAFIQTGLLLATCAWIVVEAVRRLVQQRADIEPSLWAFLVMFLSVAVDYSRSRALRRAARRYESQALEADALHFSTDVWSSLVVIFGLTLVWAGHRYGIPQLVVADPLAALGVSGIAVYISLQLGKRTVDALLDAAPSGIRTELVSRVQQVEGVLGCERLRVRRAGNRYFVDTIISVERLLPFEQVKAISDQVEDRIHEMLPGADVIIHTEPRPPRESSMFEKVKSVAARHNLFVHEMAAHDIAGNRHLELHLEVSDRLTLRQAHDLVTQVETEILQEIPEVGAINTHIENEGTQVEFGRLAMEEHASIEKRLRKIAAKFPEILDCHEILVRRVRDRLYVSCHCTMNGDLPIARVHEITADLETQFKREFPGVFRVTIHSEPAGSPAA